MEVRDGSHSQEAVVNKHEMVVKTVAFSSPVAVGF